MSRKFKDTEWTCEGPNGRILSWEAAQTSVLMDLRDELKQLNRLLNCGNFLDIPNILRRIERNTRKRRYVRKAKP